VCSELLRLATGKLLVRPGAGATSRPRLVEGPTVAERPPRASTRDANGLPDRLEGETNSIVELVTPSGPTKLLRLANGVLTVGRYAIVTRGDNLVHHGRSAAVQLTDGQVPIVPAYRTRHRMTIGSAEVSVTVQEITAQSHLDGYRRLLDFHYRGERGFGRRAVLVVTTRAPEFPEVLGFVELTTGFLMSKPRTRLLSAPFNDRSHSWDEWGAHAMRSLTSLIARISRLVVHPELRGVGIGTLLTKEALRYARLRFHANGMRPLFVEITADMMKFVPFARRAGMTYIGETEGNLHRVAKDLRYLLADDGRLSSPQLTATARGIMSAQRRYAQAFAAMDVQLDDLAERLKAVNGTVDADLYRQFSQVLRLPKPTYLAGLTPRARRFVEQRAITLGVSSPPELEIEPVTTLSAPISVRDLTVMFRSSVGSSKRTSAIEQAFGIQPSHLESRVLNGVNFEVRPGQIALVYGPSGAGKTTLLRLLDGSGLPREGNVTGRVSVPEDAVIGHFKPVRSKRPLIELVAKGRHIRSAIYALNAAGLTDAHLYLRRFDELSDGQKYRAMLASLIGSPANVWIADEFLSSLDPLTATVVAANVAKHARRHGVTMLVGAPHFASFIEALEPDVVLRLSSAWEYEVSRGKAFVRRWRATRQ
jgi:ABC-type transport system involved in cytochrome c biogenesis ATPase subunit/GNAT superfamily N-acetyltransferase